MPSSIISIGQGTGHRRTSCGYCSPPGQRSDDDTFVQSAGLSALQLSCDVYQGMIDRGWRRSGTWCYKPWLKKSCCPQYTIRLDATAFSPSKSQRKLINRWNRFVKHGDDANVTMQDGSIQTKGCKPPPKAQARTLPFNFLKDLHSSEAGLSTATVAAHHKFEVTLEPSSFTPEKYELYDMYQRKIHNDSDNTPSGFKRFLVTSPLAREPIPYSSTQADAKGNGETRVPGSTSLDPSFRRLPSHYGSFHQMYRLDGKLIAIGVLDILPSCVSSVYFMYDPAWDKFSLGKLSALREIALVRELHKAGAMDLKYLYMGFYIHSCQKMRYKGDYQPSDLADPEDYTWHPLKSVCAPLLDKNRYACFSCPENSSDEAVNAVEDLNSSSSTSQVPETTLAVIQATVPPIRSSITILPLTVTQAWNEPEQREEVSQCIRGLGDDIAKEMIFLVYC